MALVKHGCGKLTDNISVKKDASGKKVTSSMPIKKKSEKK